MKFEITNRDTGARRRTADMQAADYLSLTALAMFVSLIILVVP